jgi:abequosyltransferase
MFSNIETIKSGYNLPLLTIVIPTKNRIDYLKRNLDNLNEILTKNHLTKIIHVIVSDNNSQDGTQEYLLRTKSHYPKLKIKTIINQENLTGQNNSFVALSKAVSNFIMFMGDDDYINSELMAEVIEILQNNSKISTVVVNSIQYHLLEKKFNSKPRGKIKRTKIYKWHIFSLGLLKFTNNLSGHVFKRSTDNDDTKEAYNNYFYPHIYSIAQSMKMGQSAYITNNPIEITIGNSQSWHYDPLLYLENNVELINSVSKSSVHYYLTLINFLIYQGFHRINKNGWKNFYSQMVTSHKLDFISKFILSITIPLDVIRIKIRNLRDIK